MSVWYRRRRWYVGRISLPLVPLARSLFGLVAQQP